MDKRMKTEYTPAHTQFAGSINTHLTCFIVIGDY